jgi:copper chaperone CopZ
MLLSTKGLFVAAMAGVTGVAALGLCPLCGGSAQAASAQTTGLVTPASDTATARLHISRMTCGSCPATARVALGKLPGVYGATITLDDSLGVVRYDPRRVTPVAIAAHLTRLTGFGATVI